MLIVHGAMPANNTQASDNPANTVDNTLALLYSRRHMPQPICWCGCCWQLLAAPLPTPAASTAAAAAPACECQGRLQPAPPLLPP